MRAVNRYTSRHWDYYGAKLTYTNFRRDGKMRNGRYPDSSYGKGIRHQFTDITVKGGLTYKFNGAIADRQHQLRQRSAAAQ